MRPALVVSGQRADPRSRGVPIFDALTGTSAAVLLRGTIIGDCLLVADDDTCAQHWLSAGSARTQGRAECRSLMPLLAPALPCCCAEPSSATVCWWPTTTHAPSTGCQRAARGPKVARSADL